jgi:outer membrane protein TolC
MKFYAILLYAVAVVARGETNSVAANTNGVLITPEYLSALAEESHTNNAALRAAKARIDAARANEQSIRTWEDPMARFGFMPAERSMRANDGDILVGVEQKLPLFGKPQAMRRMAQEETKVEAANADYQFQQLRRDMALEVFKTALANRVVEIGEQDLFWLAEMEKTAGQRYEVGNATQVDVLRLQNERAKRATELKTDQSMLEQEKATLNRMLNRPLLSSWPALRLPELAKQVVFTERLVDFAIKYEPKLKMLQQEISRAEAAVDSSRRQRHPDISVGGEIRHFSETGDYRQGMLTVSMSLPWGNRKKYDADIQREQQKQKAAQLDAADYEIGLRAEIHHLVIRIDAARRQALLYHDDIIPRTKTALDSTVTSWVAGRSILTDLLDARRMLLDAQLSYARAVSDQYQALSDLVLCCGIGDIGSLEMIGALPEEKSQEKK